MAPIPVYSSSAINAAKASGVTPQTATPADASEGGRDSQGRGQGQDYGQVQGQGQDRGQGQHQPETSITTATFEAYPPVAQPGALPSLPKQTATPLANNVLPTPTQTNSSLSGKPPLPQPGAVPVPPGYSASNPNALPPPPKAGESVNSQQQVAPVVTAMPPQMMYEPPRASMPTQGRSSTSTEAPFMVTGLDRPGPTSVQGQHPSAGYSPPAGGYRQDVAAAGYNQYSRSTAAFENQGQASVWDTAKKWAASAGESLAAAENEVWKRINRD
ncbi:hypothetical protein E4U09_002407 [Claviceps aff. purpurea]|uniref:Uncharacterized protein n=1 Tax=Claviceps aff. purpurea TaxID=1967640 RepID=A0A9P7QHW7_9HYPO|nr:hypothetical protein E4U09_002407 [Claviceps aff. purpurea]